MFLASSYRCMHVFLGLRWSFDFAIYAASVFVVIISCRPGIIL